VDLLAHGLDLVGLEPEALRDIPAGVVPTPHPEDVAVVEVALVVRPEGRVRVRVFGQLEDRVHASTLIAQ